MEVAAAELAAQAQACLEQQIPQAGLIFSTYGLDHSKLLATLCALLPTCPILGASSYGEVSHKLGYRLRSSVLILFASDSIRIQAGVLRGLDAEDEIAQAEAIECQLAGIRRQSPPPVLGLLFPDGLGSRNEGLIRVVADLLPETALFGAGAAESLHTRRICLFKWRSAEENLTFFRNYYGPTLRAFERLDKDSRQQPADALITLSRKYDRNRGRGSVSIEGEYLESIITRA